MLALVEGEYIPAHVPGAPEKKPRAVRRKSEPEPPRGRDVAGRKAPVGITRRAPGARRAESLTYCGNSTTLERG